MKQAEILLDQIEFGERFRKDYGNITELVTSIKKEGLIQPLAVYAQPDKKQPYLLLAGGRRFTACTKAGLEKVPCLIFDTLMSDLDVRSIELAENIYRKDLEWHEKIRLEAEIHRLQTEIHGKGVAPGTSGEATGWTQKKTAELIGVDPGKVTKDLKLASLLEHMPELKDICKNADEARKMIGKAVERMERNNAAQKVIEKQTNTPLDIQRRRLVDRFIIGDFYELVKKIPSGSVDIVEMDPPYGIDLNEAKKSDDGMNLQMGDYYEIPKTDYLVWMDRYLAECYRVMAPDSWLICWFGPEPWFDAVFQLIIKNNFYTNRLAGIWIKEGQTGQSKRPDIYLANNYEMFFYARKGNPTIKKQGRSNVFIYAPVVAADKEHPTEKPIELYTDILQTFGLPEQTLMIPFLGSGASLFAAENLGMKAFGYEKALMRKDSFTIKAFKGRPGEYRSYH